MSDLLFGIPLRTRDLELDLTGDGRIDEADLALWQQNYDPLGLGVR